MRVLVAGSDTSSNVQLLTAALSRLHAQQALTRVIHADTTALDRAASGWAAQNSVCELAFSNQWNRRCMGGDPLGRMILAGRPTLALLLPGYPLTIEVYFELAPIKAHRIGGRAHAQ